MLRVIVICLTTTLTVDIFSKASVKAIPRTQKSPDDKIVYPEPIDNFNEEDVPEECKRKTFCTKKPKNYPEADIKKTIDKIIPVSGPLPEPVTLDTRQGNPDFIDGCETHVSVEPLYLARNDKSDTWKTIMQAPDQNFKQTVRLETCASEGESCFHDKTIQLLPGAVTSCIQRWTEFQVTAWNKELKKPEVVSVKLPVCCSCKFKIQNF